jgi:threonyl-tRNA synthetase
MNCPFHIAIYKNSLKSYRDLPLRWAELGTVYRYERSGQLHGLMRVRGFTQDDAHIFMRPDQLESEIRTVVNFSLKLLADYGFTDLDIMVATKPAEKSIGSKEIWDQAESALKAGLEAEGVKYTIDEGGGAFYGPKIDVKIKDAIGRVWQCTTVQVDFNLPERFDLSYIGEDSKKHRPVMIHRALLGSIERFFGIMLEHYAGAFPMWMAPVQVAVLTVADRHEKHAIKVKSRLEAAGIRCELNTANDKLGAKIRQARLARIPATVVIGDTEMEQNGVSLKTRTDGDLGFISLDEFIETITKKSAAPEI